MAIIIVLASIYLITLLAWPLRRFTPIKVCPICAGVSGTWLWLLIGGLTGRLPITGYQLPIAILIGGSVVGIAYQLEKRLPKDRSPLLWKVLFIPTGFAAAYFLINFWWAEFFTVLVIMILIAIIFLNLFSARHREGENKKIKELEKEMEDCC